MPKIIGNGETSLCNAVAISRRPRVLSIRFSAGNAFPQSL